MKQATREAGFSVIEVLVASSLALIVLIAAYDFIDSTNRSYSKETGLASAQNTGRVGLDIFATELRAAGYSPLGYPFYGIANGDASRVRLMADLDGDGLVGTAGETDENVSYLFQGPDAAGLYTLLRGIDLNADWLFSGSGESLATVATNVVRVDANGDSTLDPFLVYDLAPPVGNPPYNPAAPATSRVTVSFGVRSTSRDPLARQYPVVTFHSDVSLRNLNW
jgi:hypothetical protein